MAPINSLKMFGLVLLLWNCRSLLSNLIEFKYFLYKNEPDIICLTETWFLVTTSIQFSNYKIYRADRFGINSRGGGIAILIKKSISSKLCTSFNPYTDGFLEHLVVEIFIENNWSKICTLYNPCKNVTEDEFEYYFSGLGNNSIIAGDFNAHHPIWSDRFSFSNFSGRSLANTLNSNLLFNLITPVGTPTHFIHNSQILNSTIDLVFGSGIFSITDHVQSEELLGTSDHFPIFYCFKSAPNSYFKSNTLSWSFHNLKWDKWKSDLSLSLDQNKSYNLNDISDILISCTEKHSKLTSKHKKQSKNKYFWNSECSKAVALRRKARRKYEKHICPANRVNYNKQSALTKKEIKKQKRLSWITFTNSLTHNSSDSKVWKVFRKMEGKFVFDFNYPIEKNKKLLINNTEIAKEFAIYFNNSFNNLYKHCLHDKMTTISFHLSLHFDTEYNVDFNISELKNVINTLNKNSAMGIDNIHNKFLSNFPPNLYPILLNSLNISWNSGLLPDSLKLSTLIPILKPNKSPNMTDSYRPIALLSCLGKLMEKLVYNRLYSYLENKNSLPRFQCGFRKQHSCLDILLYLENYIQLALRTKKVLIIVFFDISKAFDSASHTNILYNLINKGIRGKLLRWLSDFLSNRTYKVRIGNTYSETYNITTGVPQGAILSPLLFSILLSNPPLVDDVHSLFYADDISLFSIADDISTAIHKLQEAINKYSNWLTNLNLMLNPGKSKYMIFTRKKITNPPILKLNNNSINLVTTHKFLGLTLDAPFLTWRKHINYIKSVCSRRLSILRALNCSNWGSNRQLLKNFYLSFIRSKIAYGLEVYSSASKSLIQSLEIINNNAIRIITGLRRSTPITSILYESGITSITNLITFLLAKQLTRIYKLPSNHISFHLINTQSEYLESISWNKFQHKSPFYIRAIRACNLLNYKLEEISKIQHYFLSPWFDINSFIRVDFGGFSSKNSSGKAINLLFTDLTSTKYVDYLRIFTDGSKQSSGEVGSASFIEQIHFILSWNLSSDHSVLAAELFAISCSLDWLLENPQYKKSVIFTDSLSSLKMIQGCLKFSYFMLISKIQKQLYKLASSSREIVLQWIPSHTIPQNDIADTIAKQACWYEEPTFLPLELEESISLLKTKFFTYKRQLWERDKLTLHLFKILDDIYKWKWISSGSKHCDALLARFRSGSVGLRKYLFKMKLVDSPYCLHCSNNIEESIIHFLLECPRYTDSRAKLVLALKKLNICTSPVSLSILLDGAGFSPQKRVKIMWIFYNFLKSTGKLSLL